MLVGLVIAAVISALVPDGFFAEKPGTGIFAMVVMMFLGNTVSHKKTKFDYDTFTDQSRHFQ